MTSQIISVRTRQISAGVKGTVPALIADAVANARFAYEEFFAGIDSAVDVRLTGLPLVGWPLTFEEGPPRYARTQAW